jgi:hypothetical protein
MDSFSFLLISMDSYGFHAHLASGNRCTAMDRALFTTSLIGIALPRQKEASCKDHDNILVSKIVPDTGGHTCRRLIAYKYEPKFLYDFGIIDCVWNCSASRKLIYGTGDYQNNHNGSRQVFGNTIILI